MPDSEVNEPSGRGSRRSLLSTLTVGISALAGCLKPSIERVANQQEDTATSTPTPTSDQVTVDVGADGEFGFFAGTDTPLRIRTGTTVDFVWRTDSHTIVVEQQPDGANWQGTPAGREEAYDKGYVHEYEFTVPGRYRFHCAPHETIGATGTIEVVDG